MTKKEKMFALVSKWRTTELTRREFALQHNIASSSFEYWCRKQFNEQEKPSEGSPRFIELKSNANSILPEANLRPQIELEFSSGLRIKVY